MNDLLIRRRVLMANQEEDLSQYAITAKTNPEMMAALYAEGVAANPKYMTKEEAAVAFVGQTLPASVCRVPHCDLRWFGWHNKSFGATPLKKLTLPNMRNPINVNTFWGWPNDGIIVMPEGVTSFDPVFINSTSVKNMTIVIESITPPTIEQKRPNFFYGPLSSVSVIYVPDESIDAYTSYEVDAWGVIVNFYSQYTLKPISEYVEQ